MDAAKYSAIEVLRNGRRIEIRALKPDDRTGWLEYIERTSDAARYRRFCYRFAAGGRSPTGTMMCAYGVPFHMT